MKKYLLIVFLLFASVSLVIGEGNPESVSYGSAGPPILDYYEGRVTVNGHEADFGQKIAPGSVIQAGEDSYCEIVVGHNILRIYENTVAVVKVDAFQSSLDLRIGAVGAVLDKVQTISSGGAFAVETPTAVAGVRGTVFYVNVESSESTYVCTCNGTLHITEGDEEASFSNSASHHSAYRFTMSDEGLVTRAQAGMDYHDDEEMEDIAGQIDSSIDWTSQ